MAQQSVTRVALRMTREKMEYVMLAITRAIAQEDCDNVTAFLIASSAAEFPFLNFASFHPRPSPSPSPTRSPWIEHFYATLECSGSPAVQNILNAEISFQIHLLERMFATKEWLNRLRILHLINHDAYEYNESIAVILLCLVTLAGRLKSSVETEDHFGSRSKFLDSHKFDLVSSPILEIVSRRISRRGATKKAAFAVGGFRLCKKLQCNIVQEEWEAEDDWIDRGLAEWITSVLCVITRVSSVERVFCIGFARFQLPPLPLLPPLLSPTAVTTVTIVLSRLIYIIVMMESTQQTWICREKGTTLSSYGCMRYNRPQSRIQRVRPNSDRAFRLHIQFAYLGEYKECALPPRCGYKTAVNVTPRLVEMCGIESERRPKREF
ncbi:hypothetical protein EAG_11607 [Camponotus floridanus]|uniref:Uncharacterized protein n=1 Tax=Camponotus floridanus TaxID=104421 RepID=E2A4L6_CAMFO|nr:hypothetical protein EAG_11607 [Camponotus floridanus]